ncbi:glycoside hydrolase family 65 protein [Corynebacterium tapiri]
MRQVDVFGVDGWSPKHLSDRETLFGTANGYWGTRASLPGTKDDGQNYPGTYVAGIFNRVYTENIDLESEHVPNVFDWTYLRIVDEQGRQVLPFTDEVLDFRREIDLGDGISVTHMRVRDTDGRITRVSVNQLTSLTDRHVAGMKVTVEPENWSGEVTIESAINPHVRNRNVADDRMLDTRHFDTPRGKHVDARTALVSAETRQSRVTVAVATQTTCVAGAVSGEGGEMLDSELVGHRFRAHAADGQPASFEKLATCYTSRDRAVSTPEDQALWKLGRLGSFDELAQKHADAWTDWWRVFDINLGGTRLEELAMQVNIFHVLQAVALVGEDLDVGLPARGITGEGYRGHIFWDEVYVYPLLTTHQPELTKALLRYRHRRLEASREIAQADGFRGALFAWQSGSTGREETPYKLYNPRTESWMPDNSHNQRHVALEVAYSAWRLFQYTGDRDFLRDTGAELMIETARAFSSMAQRGENGRYSIEHVMGPDEFHDGYPDNPGSGLKDNAYNNVMASWVLRRAARVFDHIDELESVALRRRLAVTDEELALFDDVSRNLTLHFHADGVLSQFDGYEQLKEFDWEGYREKYGNIGRLDLILASEGDQTNRYKLSKQADTLMLFYLFNPEELDETLAHMGYELSREDAQKTVDYYRARTSDGSTLSQFVHSWAISQFDLDEGYELYRQALEADLDNDKGSSTSEGVHCGVMGGTADMVMRCFGGLAVRGDTLCFDPRLPEAVDHITFVVRFRGAPVHFHFDGSSTTLSMPRSFAGPVDVEVAGEHGVLRSGEELKF